MGTKPALALLFALPLCAQSTPDSHRLNIDSFEKVWTTIRDKHWQKNPGGLDWQAIHEEFRPRIERAKNIDEVRAILKEMLGRLHQTHFGILPATLYEEAGPLASAASPDAIMGDGSAGIELRMIDAQPVVTRIDPGSPAERAGIKPGWAILSANGFDMQTAARALAADPSIPEAMATRALLTRITGPIGAKMQLAFDSSSGNKTEKQLSLGSPRGDVSDFGNLPSERVWFEFRKIDNAGYIRFNYFLDLPHVIPKFGDAIQACLNCNGLIIDLRGNPGGIGAMAMGMAGYLLDKEGQRLGTMVMREAEIKFVVNPRFPGFEGPVAILLDACSASTSEIFAGGLKDLGRARVFGTKSEAAALPSVIERLPNGDGFQYAVGNYISEGGRPLEGEGVTPDVEVKLTRAALLAGRDPVIDAAMNWIKGAGAAKQAK